MSPFTMGREKAEKRVMGREWVLEEKAEVRPHAEP